MTLDVQGGPGAWALYATDGNGAAVSLADWGGIRYHVAAQRWEKSENTGAWEPFAADVDSKVLDDPGSVTSPNDAVGIVAADQVGLADASAGGIVYAVGFVVSKPTATTAIVRYAGELGGFAGLTAGNLYYVNTVGGSITNVPPAAAGTLVQPVGMALSATELVVGVSMAVRIN